MLLPLLLFLPGLVEARRFLDPAARRRVAMSNGDSTVPWTVNWFNVKLDHFTYSDTRTFQIKWLLNDTYYKPGGPIFFYTGNEGDVEGFATATGMMWDLAPMFNAAIIFAEHRFYGASLPFDNESYSTIENMGYLTSEQALADFASLLFALKAPDNGLPVTYPQNATVIAFGGSYGGMLSAWFRIKYPHVVTGAWAASAPLLYFKGEYVDYGAFDAITADTFVNAGCNRYIVANSWNAILNLSSSAEGREFLNSQFNIDPKSKITSTDGGWNLNYYFREAIEYMAMVNYPYPTEFLEPLPAWPVKVACSFMSTPGTSFSDRDLATRMYYASNIYYNYTGSLKYNCIDPNVCGDPGTFGLGDTQLGWPWQECSEIIIDMCARGGKNDFFWDECQTNSTALLNEQCLATFASFKWTTDVWDVNAVPLLYGVSLSSVSNIILTQGELDPWSGRGYATNSPGLSQDRGIYVIKIPGAAHHLDLRTPNTCDPNTIANARYQIVSILRCWISGGQSLPRLTDIPKMVVPTDEHCRDLIGSYPWGQNSGHILSWALCLLVILRAL